MLGAALERGGEAQHLVLVAPRLGQRRPRAPACRRSACRSCRRPACRPSRRLQRLGVPDQHAGLRAAPGRRHDRHRRRQAERAGAGDDQHRDGGDERIGERRRRPPDRPGEEGEGGHGDHRRARTSRRRRRRASGSARASAAPRRPSRRCGRAWCPCRRAWPRITRLPVPLIVAPVTGSPATFSTGKRLAGEHRFVDRRAALDHRAVDRDLLAGTHAEPVADPDLLERRSPPRAPSGRITRAVLGGEVEERADGRAGALAGAELEHLAEEHQDDDHRGGLEIDRRPGRNGRGSRRGTSPGRARRRG